MNTVYYIFCFIDLLVNYFNLHTKENCPYKNTQIINIRFDLFKPVLTQWFCSHIKQFALISWSFNFLLSTKLSHGKRHTVFKPRIVRLDARN